jgi:hypothetical protein
MSGQLLPWTDLDETHRNHLDHDRKAILQQLTDEGNLDAEGI